MILATIGMTGPARHRNLRTALILLSIAAVFFIGVIVNRCAVRRLNRFRSPDHLHPHPNPPSACGRWRSYELAHVSASSFVIAAVMFGFGYAMIPIYRAICEVTGVGFMTQRDAEAAAEFARNTQVDTSRKITVEFDAMPVLPGSSSRRSSLG
jgi:hypothetical protein